MSLNELLAERDALLAADDPDMDRLREVLLLIKAATPAPEPPPQPEPEAIEDEDVDFDRIADAAAPVGWIAGNDADLDELLMSAAYLVHALPSVELLERRGDWLWLHTKDRISAPAIKAAGFQYSAKKTAEATAAAQREIGVWYWSAYKSKRRYRGNVSERDIKAKYGAVSLKDDR